MTVDSVVHIPTCSPSGEQTDWPGVVQEPAEEPVDAVPEAEAGAALEPDELSTGVGNEPAAEDGEAGAAVEGEAATEGAAAATDGEASTAGAAAAADIGDAAVGAAAAGDDAAAATTETPELPALEA